MNCKPLLLRFQNDESGQDLIEYGLTAAPPPLAAVSNMGRVDNSIASVCTEINGNL